MQKIEVQNPTFTYIVSLLHLTGPIRLRFVSDNDYLNISWLCDKIDNNT